MLTLSGNEAGVFIVLQLVLNLLTIIAVRLMHGKVYRGISVAFHWLNRRQLLSGADLDRRLSTMTHIESFEQHLHLFYRYYSILPLYKFCLYTDFFSQKFCDFCITTMIRYDTIQYDIIY